MSREFLEAVQKADVIFHGEEMIWGKHWLAEVRGTDIMVKKLAIGAGTLDPDGIARIVKYKQNRTDPHDGPNRVRMRMGVRA